MSLFEYDQGHLIPAQFGHPVGSEAQGEILDSVRRQVLEVIARPLFPVTWSDMSTAAIPVAGMPQDSLGEEDGKKEASRVSPRLTALDGSGQVVLVEVMEKLDSQTLIESLARLGAISNLGWNDLAAAYPGGVGAFRAGWTQFRDAMPPNLTAGPRLILVTTEIDPGVRPALDALTTSGLEVHHVSVREMSNGRRFLDVQRVAASLFSHDPNLLAGRAARMPALTSEAAEDFPSSKPGTGSSASAETGVGVETESKNGKASETDKASEARSEAESKAGRIVPQRDSDAKSAQDSEPASVATSDNAPAESQASSESLNSATPEKEPESTVEPVDEPSLQTGSISRHSIMEAAMSSPVSPLAKDEDDEPVESLFSTAHGSNREEDEPSFSEVLFGAESDEAEREPDSFANESNPDPTIAELGDTESDEASNSGTSVSTNHSHRARGSEDADIVPDSGVSSVVAEEEFIDIDGLLSHDSLGLEAIAQVTGEDTPLFGAVNFGDEAEKSVVQATLLELGSIELEGRTFASPRDAALAVGAPESIGDGWGFWHLGLEEGPTLAEACEEINIELRREAD